jgi:hypothetical protein
VRSRSPAQTSPDYHGSMSLAHAWRRQLYGVSSAALIVPGAMLAALLVLVFAGGFSQVGVLKQIFAGPSLPAPGAIGGTSSGSHGAGTASTPAIPVAAAAKPAAQRSIVRANGSVPRSGGSGTTHAGGGVRTSGGAATGGGLTTAPSGGGQAAPAPTVTIVAQAPAPAPAPSPVPAPGGSSPKPPRPPARTPVDTVVNTITSVTQQAPAPAGPVATSVVQAAGAVADQILPTQGLP